jgi:crotonobetainyl-CoA:carnitine CoA-transferase CaiB-like acyl-CoA transferase
MQNHSQAGPRPLDGVTVLDLTIALAGPFATLLLAGLGARVIKVENPAGGDPCRTNPPYLGEQGASLTRRHPDDFSISALNRLRNKLGITLNLKSPDARAIVADLRIMGPALFERFSGRRDGTLWYYGALADVFDRRGRRLLLDHGLWE